MLPLTSHVLSGALERLAARPIVVATHPRSGTHLLIDSLRRNFPACSIRKWPLERVDRLYLTAEAMMQRSRRMGSVTALRTLVRARRPVVKTHTLPGFEPWYVPAAHEPLSPEFRDWFSRRGCFVHMRRDGRAAVLSFYTLLRASGLLGTQTFSSFLRSRGPGSSAENAARGWAEHVRSWMERSEVLSLSFEELIREPRMSLERVAEHAGLRPDWSEPLIPPAVRTGFEYRMARLRGGRPESSAILPPHGISESRKWHQVFNYEDCVFFERETAGLLVELGYESSCDWPERIRNMT